MRYKNFDVNKFIENVRNLSWWDIYHSDDVDQAVDLLTTKRNSILNIMAPVKTFQTNSKQAWAELDQAQLPLELGFTSFKVCCIILMIF